ncbi:M56 family metallopeptidase [Lacimicrobium alkaliphilum]|uniref:Protein TonB n=1 Tax=Lacimicrobium alkaliphilum TaxID=1526571 RepID=A0ABQ1RNN3_9ALTE|nr:M56 family metallopeptidase [Lacimicrobium alkaliphilum]GGD73078.1 hypothetical protein GCM10011357_30190 [Lacimicrobium alkaliphilum]
MASWILSQQVVLCVTLLLLLLLERKAARDLGARTLYALWLLLPLTLMVNNLPVDLVSLENHTLNRYVVVFSSQSQQVGAMFSWQLLWIVGGSGVIGIAFWQQWRISRLCTVPANHLTLPRNFPENLTVAMSKEVGSPVLIGLFKPKLIVPASFLADFSSAQQQMILQHELVHYRRRDNFFNLCALLFVALFWFNPLVWLAYSAFRRSQELACDAVVLGNKNRQEKILYSKALLRCAEMSLQPSWIYSQYGDKHSMRQRIELIKNNGSIKGSLLATVLLLSGGLLTGIAMANQQSKVQGKKVSSSALVERVEPKYPIYAAENELEGSVVLQFDINADGSTDNIEVVKAIPEETFNKVSIAALQQWKYKPEVINGQAVKQTNLLVQLNYRMERLPEGETIPPLIEDSTANN